MVPVVPIYSSFYQRAFDQVIHDVAIQNLSVVMCVDRAGIVGNDGETHQGIFDLSFFSMIPNLTIMAPKDFKEFENMLEYSIGLNKPVVIRYPRGGEGEIKFDVHENLEDQRAEFIKKGNDITIIAIGKMVEKAVKVANILENQAKTVEVINSRFLKPLDNEDIIKSIVKTKRVVTIEDNIINGGLGSKIEEIIANCKIDGINFRKYGYPDEFVKHGSVSEIERKYGLDDESLAKDINDWLN